MEAALTNDCRSTLSAMIAPHLPYLRRYARALCGGRESGDAAVASTLRTLLDDAQAIDRSLPPRVALYRLFQAATLRGRGAPPEAVDIPLARRFLILSALEEFSDEDAAIVLGLPPQALPRLMEEAKAELSAFVEAKIMIIEDETIIALDLEALILDMGHSVAGVADTHQKAVVLAEATRPDLIMADIQLGDGSSGVEAIEEILSKFHVPVVFVTAYPERLLTGEQAEPTFLVSKPYRAKQIRAVVSQALFHHRPERVSAAS